MTNVSRDNNDDQEVPELPCPVSELPCPVWIEAASEIIEGKELVPKYALRRYTFAQLETHLESNI